ncbi:MAG TPA: glycosyltransferase family 4 protein [Methylobacterium sp.]|jgi:glycosyltransferase involved in cell wall biosynthesis
MVAARAFPFSGGIETHIHEVGRRMAERGHRVDVLTADPTGRLPATESVGGVAITRVRSWPEHRDYCFAPGLLTRMGRDFDVVHVQGYHTFSAPFGMLGALRRKIPFVLTFHSGGHSSGLRTAIRGAHQRLLGPLAGRAARLVAVSEFEADHFACRMRIPRDRFTVVPNGASLPRPSAPASAGSGGPLIVSLGRLERYKGHHRVIEAFSHVLTTLPQARLRILGEGPYEPSLRALARRLGLEDRIAIGAIPARDRAGMADVLASAALVVLWSDYEAHPVAVMEALSLGRPVVTSDTSGFRELADQDLITAIPLDTAPGEAAKVMVGEILAPRPPAGIALPDWEQCTDRLLAIYRSLTGESAQAPLSGRLQTANAAASRRAGR